MNAIRYIATIEHTDKTKDFVFCNKLLHSGNNNEYFYLDEDEFRALILAEEVENEIYVYPTVVRTGYQDRIISYSNGPELAELKRKYKELI